MRLIMLACSLAMGTAASATAAVVTLTLARDNTLIQTTDGDLSNGAGTGAARWA